MHSTFHDIGDRLRKDVITFALFTDVIADCAARGVTAHGD